MKIEQRNGGFSLGIVDTNSIKKILILAGGTGGHVIPALSVAEHFQGQGVAVHWMGTASGLEALLVPAAKIPITFIDIQGLRGHSWRRWLKAPGLIGRAIWQSIQILREQKPDVVLSMGGYVAGPGAVAAWLLGIPLLLHEQNAIEGWTNRLLSRFAKRIMVAFPALFEGQKNKVVYTGNPVRREILNVRAPAERWADRTSSTFNIVVLGGSLGAAILNETVPQALALFSLERRPLVWHQTGKRHLETTHQQYMQCGVTARVDDFIHDMSQPYQWADVIICRSGALTIAEIAAVGVPAILIPFPQAIGDHQTANARFLAESHAAILLPQTECTPMRLYEILSELMTHPAQRLEMANRCRQLAKPKATVQVAEQCIEVGCGA